MRAPYRGGVFARAADRHLYQMAARGASTIIASVPIAPIPHGHCVAVAATRNTSELRQHQMAPAMCSDRHEERVS